MYVHRIKFFPKYNAFTISPAPSHSTDGGEFCWNFVPNNLYIFEWDLSGLQEVPDIFIKFKPRGATARKHPIKAGTLKGAEDQNDGGLKNAKDSNQIRFEVEVNHEEAHWSFDFICGDYIVDPEIKIRTGTN